MTSNRISKLVIFSMLSAIILLLTFTPLGFIQLGFIKATIIHIPVIIGSIMLGPSMGAGLGFMFAVASLISNTMSPTVSSFVFSPLIPLPGQATGSPWSLIVCFIPRILVGVVPWAIYKLFKKKMGKNLDFAALAISGITGSLTNTLLVMNLIFLIFKDSYAVIKGVEPGAVYGIILSIIAANGIPEALVAAILTAAVCKALFAAFGKQLSTNIR